MPTIQERLREAAQRVDEYSPDPWVPMLVEVSRAAANRIEELTEALEQILGHDYDDDTDVESIANDFDDMREIAREAIKKATA